MTTSFFLPFAHILYLLIDSPTGCYVWPDMLRSQLSCSGKHFHLYVLILLCEWNKETINSNVSSLISHLATPNASKLIREGKGTRTPCRRLKALEYLESNRQTSSQPLWLLHSSILTILEPIMTIWMTGVRGHQVYMQRLYALINLWQCLFFDPWPLSSLLPLAHAPSLQKFSWEKPRWLGEM